MVAADFVSLSRTAYQRIYGVVPLRQRKLPFLGNIGAKKIAEELRKGARLSKDTELATTGALGFVHSREGLQAKVRYQLPFSCSKRSAALPAPSAAS